MSKIQEEIEKIEEYFNGLYYQKGVPVVNVTFKNDWNMDAGIEDENIQYQKRQSNQNGTTWVITHSEKNIDKIFSCIKNIIQFNKERERKSQLFRQRVEELKQLFEENNLKDLQNLKFEFKNGKFDVDGEMEVNSPVQNSENTDKSEVNEQQKEKEGQEQ